jgi:hypothetical protein
MREIGRPVRPVANLEQLEKEKEEETQKLLLHHSGEAKTLGRAQ